MRRLRGLRRLIHDAIDRTTDLVERTHQQVSGTTRKYLELGGPAVALPAQAVDGVIRTISSGVYAAIHGVNRVVDQVTEVGLDAVEQARGEGEGEEIPAPMRSDAVGSLEWLGDTALGALNGVVGDYLHDQGNELDLGMSLRHQDSYLPLERAALEAALEEPTDKVVVFVHGLCCTEWSWCLKAHEYYGDPSASFGTLLRRDLGLTPLYVRYNTGRHISHNGRLLGELLERLVSAAYPARVRQLVLIGHSMGGLVIRSACHLATTEGWGWLSPLTHVICLGTPHRGAPLEKLGNVATAILGAFDTPGAQLPATIINARSAGIKDLRYGSLTDEDWAGKDPDALLAGLDREVPLLDGVTYGFISACLTASPGHPLGQLVGDMLVRVPSASGPRASAGRFRLATHHHGGMNHFELQNHPDVYEEVRRLCAGEGPAFTAAVPGRPGGSPGTGGG